jgi:cysteine synthase
MMGAALGLAVVLYMPANANMERKGMIARYCAHIVDILPMRNARETDDHPCPAFRL